MAQTLQSICDDDKKFIKKHVIPVSHKRAKWLRKRPWWKQCHTKLQDEMNKFIPGTHICASMGEDDYSVIKKILRGISVLNIGRKVLMRIMQPSACFYNTQVLLNKGKIKEIHKGFALSLDGVWRFHAWGIGFNNVIVETTEHRIAYLTGKILQRKKSI